MQIDEVWWALVPAEVHDIALALCEMCGHVHYVSVVSDVCTCVVEDMVHP